MNTHAEILIGQVHVAVADVERSLAFYCGLIGLLRGKQIGDLTVLVPKTNHHIIIDPPHRALAIGTQSGHAGIYHFSFLYTERKELGRVIQRFIDTAYEIDRVCDYGITQAVYLRDPDGIPVELFTERPKRTTGPHQNKDSSINVRSTHLQGLLNDLRE